MPRKLRFYHSKNSERKKQKVTSSSDLTRASNESSTDRVSELSSEELCAPSHSSSSVSEEAVSHQEIASSSEIISCTPYFLD